MYGGLFGDLPAAKGSKKDGDHESSAFSESPGTTSSTTATFQGVQQPHQAPAAADPAEFSMMLPPAVKKQKRWNPVLQAVGSAGTSMAFVPTAALQKQKRANRFANLQKSTSTATDVDSSVISPANASTTNFSTSTNSNSEPVRKTEEIETSKLASESTSFPGLGSAPTETIISAPVAAIEASFPGLGSVPTQTIISAGNNPFSGTSLISYSPFVPSVHHPEPTTTQAAHNDSYLFHPPHDSKYGNAVNDEYGDDVFHQQAPAVEEILDPYDPYVPNDLLQYWERQALVQERLELERETREALEKQQALRRKLEQEREELQRKGEYDKIIQQQQQEQVAMGRGRGRGVSNLPAWLVEKQRKEREQSLGGEPVPDPSNTT